MTYTSRDLSKYIAFNSHKVFLKKKKRSGTSFPVTFPACLFKETHFSCYILLTNQISFSDCLCFVRYWIISVLKLFLPKIMTSWTLKLTLTFLLTIGNASVIPLKLLCPIEKSIGLILAFNMLIFQINRSKAFINIRNYTCFNG